MDKSTDPQKQFYNIGFCQTQHSSNGEIVSLFKNLISTCTEKELWFRKYVGSEDSRVAPTEIAPCFDDFFIKNDLLNYVRHITGRNLLLAHSQLRKVDISKGYAPWHRDTFVNAQKQDHGVFPAPTKLIMYFSDTQIKEPIIQFKPGSHKRYWENYHLDRLFNNFSKKEDIFLVPDNLLIFDSSIYHKVNDLKNQTVYRIICSFCLPEQMHIYTKSHLYKNINETAKIDISTK